MGLLTQEIGELRQLRRDFRAGRITAEQLDKEIAVYSQIQKRTGQMLQAMSLAAKHGKIMHRIIDTNLLTEGTAIDLSIEEREAETVRCTFDNRLITRQQCLDFSGSTPERCSGCPQQAMTKKLLIGEPKS